MEYFPLPIPLIFPILPISSSLLFTPSPNPKGGLDLLIYGNLWGRCHPSEVGSASCVMQCLEEVEGAAKASYLWIFLCLGFMSKMSMLASASAQWYNLKHSLSLAHCSRGKRVLFFFFPTKDYFARAKNTVLNCNFRTVKLFF